MEHPVTVYRTRMGVQSLDRAFDLAELLARFPSGLTLVEIATRVGLHKSTVHRLLTTLKERSYVHQDEVSGRYRVGVGFVLLAGSYLGQLDLKTAAEPEMKRLSDDLGVTVFLATLRDDRAVYLDKIERYDGFRRFDIIGRSVPVYCTSLGKALVMDLPPEEQRAILERRPPERKTAKTLLETEPILDEFAFCRDRGWSWDLQEHETDVTCAGAPIRDHRGQTVAAISAVWKTVLSPAEVEPLGERIRAAAHAISATLGFVEP